MRLQDSAGLGFPRGRVALAGMEQTRSYMRRSDLVLWVIDGSRRLAPEDSAVRVAIGERRWIAVINKTDLPQVTEGTAVEAAFGPCKALCISALRGQGLSRLRRTVAGMIVGGEIPADGEDLVTNVRHRTALRRAASDLSAAVGALSGGLPEELAAADIGHARLGIRSILGEGTPGDVLDRIFEEFCIGK